MLVGLCLYTFIQGPVRGRFSRNVGLAIGVPYLIIFAATQYFGPLFSNSLPFLLYWALTAAEVLAFAGLVWRFTNQKREVHAAWWVLFMMFATYLLSYYGSYGPLKTPLVPFPWDNLIAVVIGLISYYWGVAAGYQTEEMKEIAESGTGLVTPEEEEMERRLG